MKRELVDFAKKSITNFMMHNRQRNITNCEFIPIIRGHKLQKLTDEEKDIIIKKWKGFDIDFRYFRLYKTFVGFSPDFIPDNAFVPLILRVLTPGDFAKAFQYKSLYPTFFKSLPQPETLVNSIKGVWLDDANNEISREEGLRRLRASGEFIIKSSRDSCCGLSVRKITVTDATDLDAVLNAYGEDFICQALVRQSEKTAVFNKSSLNTFRISTLNFKGKVTTPTIILRHGVDGSVVDNVGAGGRFVGVSPDGHFKPFSLNRRLKKKYELPDGTKYADICIPEVQDLVKLAEEAHRTLLPFVGFAGWDFCLDENDKPVMIEVNINYPGIICEQLGPGNSAFGDRVDEVLDYVRAHKDEITVADVVQKIP